MFITNKVVLFNGRILSKYDSRRVFSIVINGLLYPLFSLEEKGILISCQSRSLVRPSVTFLVNVSPPKP